MRTLTLLLGGAAAGAFAAFVMEKAQPQLIELTHADQAGGGPSAAPEDAADRLAYVATGRPLPEHRKRQGAMLVHYGVGAGLGAFYAFLADRSRAITAGFGSLYGALAALLLDETAVPALRLSPPPQDTPKQARLYGLASHLVFGSALEGARRLLLGWLPDDHADPQEA